MSQPFMAEIKIFSFNFAPQGWAMCNGQFMPINQNQALFSLMGTFYGGNGQTTFALPDFRGRAPMHRGTGPGLTGRSMGESGGAETHTLNIGQMAQHTHAVGVVNGPGSQTTPTGNFLAAHRGGYADSGNSAMNPGVVSSTGGAQAHPNMPPWLALNFCIALQGIFPSQN